VIALVNKITAMMPLGMAKAPPPGPQVKSIGKDMSRGWPTQICTILATTMDTRGKGQNIQKIHSIWTGSKMGKTIRGEDFSDD